MSKKVPDGGRWHDLGPCYNECGCWDCATMVNFDDPVERNKCAGDNCIVCADFEAIDKQCSKCNANTWHRKDTNECLSCKDK